MKILVFNLGTIEHRILNWGIDGFKLLFDQDVVLWGPIPDEKFVYGNKEIPILRFFEPTSISEVFKMLPDGWYPDIITCDTSVLNYIPDIYLCPVKTVLFTRDAWSDTIFNRKIVELFDFLNHATIDRPLYTSLDVNLLPLSNCAVSLPAPGTLNKEFSKREFDVISIANFNTSFYHDRYRTLYKLSESNNNRLNVKFFTGIERAEIYTYYQRSKIVLDWAHTLSNRSYEAALNGCLLLSHEDNKIISDFWIPWEEYVPYNDGNILELATFYVNNPSESIRIINNVQKKMKTIETGWGDYLWQNIKIADKTNVSIQERIDRVSSKSLFYKFYSTATPLLYNYEYNTNFPVKWEEVYYERIDKSIVHAESKEEKTAPLIEAARLSFLLKNHSLSLKYLDELIKIIPDYGWIYYLRGRIEFERGEYEKAIILLEKSIDCATRMPGLLQKYVLPVIEYKNSCDGRRITDYMWQAVYNHKNEYQVKALISLALVLSGDIYLKTGDSEKASHSYLEAINNLPLPGFIKKVSPLLIKSGDFKMLVEITEKGRENSPYDSQTILYEAIALLHTGQKRKAFEILRNHQKGLKGFIGYRKLIYLRKAISLILISAFLSKSITIKIINRLIKALDKSI